MTNEMYHAMAGGPRIGLFWLSLDKRKILYSVKCSPTEEYLVEEYGHFINSKEDHSSTWDSHPVELGVITKKFEYFHFPRGRIVYNAVSHKYYGYTGSWITNSIKTMIMAEFYLNASNCIFGIDEHYELDKQSEGLTKPIPPP